MTKQDIIHILLTTLAMIVFLWIFDCFWITDNEWPFWSYIVRGGVFALIMFVAKCLRLE
jgi:uncharacterized BrkB/YihY/UPF0761 family membrane protein